MERRRFVPRSESLETRELLSVAGAGTVATVAPLQAQAQEVREPLPTGVVSPATGDLAPEAYQTTAAPQARVRASARNPETTTPQTRLTVSPDDPNIAPLRQFRIERLPNLLASINPRRQVPAELVTALQQDLTNIANTLKPPPSNVLSAFNLQLRSTLSRASLSPQDAAALNRLFGVALERSDAQPEAIVQFRANMNALAHFNAQSSTPTSDTANDYALMLQTALGVGINYEALKVRPRATASSST